MKTRLLILGDSVTLGATEVLGEQILSTTPRSYVHDLLTDLDTWDITTDAAIHRTTKDARLLLPGVIEAHRPDILLMMLGGSDADINWRRFVASRGTRIQNSVPIDAYHANLHSFVEECRRHGVTPVLTDIPGCDLAGRTAWMAAKVGNVVAAAVEANGGGQAEVDRCCRQYNDAVESVSATTGAAVARWAGAIAHLPNADRLGPDFFHPGSAAHQLIAIALARTLRAAVGSSRSSNAMTA